MRRREFITMLGGAAAWPLAARAQQGERVRRIDVLSTLTSDDPESQARHTAFLQTLQEYGWTDGRNVRMPSAFANTLRNCSHSRLTWSWPMAPRPWRRCNGRPAACLS
jgi:hypothetical protein